MIKISSPSALFDLRHLATMVLVAVGLSISYPLSLSFLPHIVGLLGLLYIWQQDKKIPYPPKNISIILGLIFLLTFISTLWSVTPDISMTRSLKIGAEILLFIPFLILIGNLTEKTTHFIKLYFSIPIIIGAVYLLIELIFNFPFARLVQGSDAVINAWQFNKHTTVLMLMAPFGINFALQKQQKIAASLIAILCLMIAVITDSQATQLAALSMVAVAILHRFVPKVILPLCFGGTLLMFIAMPWVSQFLYNAYADKAAGSVLSPASPAQRLEIWDFVSSKTLEKPLLGFGVDTTRSIEFHGPMIYFQNTSVLHPHNIALQIWIEFGALGISLACALLAFLYYQLRLMQNNQQRISIVIFSGCMAVMLVSWSIWASWFIGLVLLLVALCRIPDTKNYVA